MRYGYSNVKGIIVHVNSFITNIEVQIYTTDTFSGTPTSISLFAQISEKKSSKKRKKIIR